MTRAELDNKHYQIRMAIDECIKNINAQSSALKNVDDVSKNLVCVLKIQDSVTEIRRLYSQLDKVLDDIENFKEDEEETQEYSYLNRMVLENMNKK